MGEWLFEAGIGEDRAILIEDGQIVEAQIELPGLRVGTVADARLTAIAVPGRQGVATLADQREVLVEPIARSLTAGAALRIEITREAAVEAGTVKRAKARITEGPVAQGPDLASRIGPHRSLSPHDPDLFEEAGWSECLDQATTGIVPFAGGTLRISLTPAMTLIDVDGECDPADLAMAGARAAAAAIRLFGIAGNIGIDLPTVAGRGERLAAAKAFDEHMPPPFERTAVNGFGFLQIIRPKRRNALCDTLAGDPAGAAVRALFRRTQRSGLVGSVRLVVPSRMARTLDAEFGPQIAALSKELGGAVTIGVRADLPMHAAYAEAG